MPVFAPGMRYLSLGDKGLPLDKEDSDMAQGKPHDRMRYLTLIGHKETDIQIFLHLQKIKNIVGTKCRFIFDGENLRVGSINSPLKFMSTF